MVTNIILEYTVFFGGVGRPLRCEDRSTKDSATNRNGGSQRRRSSSNTSSTAAAEAKEGAVVHGSCGVGWRRENRIRRGRENIFEEGVAKRSYYYNQHD